MLWAQLGNNSPGEGWKGGDKSWARVFTVHNNSLSAHLRGARSSYWL